MDVLILKVLICSLATWRISHMFIYEEGPFDIFDRLRGLVRVKYTQTSDPFGMNFLSKLLSCIYCLSVWVSFIVCVAVFGLSTWFDVATIFAVSALATLYEELTNGKS